MAIRRKHPDPPAADSTSSRDTALEGPLARWSRRKTLARSRREPHTALPTPPAPGAPAGKSEAAMPSPAVAPPEVPSIDKLDEHSDYSAFLSPEIDEKLRRVALRKLFHLSQFNVIDGLDDYAEDYTFFTPLGNIITADMRHHMEREAKEVEQQLLADGEDRAAQPDAASDESAESVAADVNEAKGVSASTDQAGASGSDDPGAPATRQTI